MQKEEGTILIVDDDESVLLVAKYLLSQRFAEVITLKDPDEIDGLLKGHAIHVALLDMNFTGGRTTGQEGFDLLQYFSDHAPDVRVILMTAYSDLDLAIKAIKQGADDFIVKPWDNDKFTNIVMNTYKSGPKVSSATTTSRVRRDTSYDHISKTLYDNFNRSREVNRVFMFLDINSATSIAEKLGHLKYFDLLNEFYEDIADPIVKHRGEIYQYVGDEVVVSWSIEEGIDNANCIKCFFNIVDVIEGLAKKYIAKYELIPGFKAGMHCGKVVAGVIGSYKKEIVYTGDVLNTTSRIVGQCKTYRVNLLFSKDLKEKIKETDHCKIAEIGEINLRGKRSQIGLFTCKRK